MQSQGIEWLKEKEKSCKESIEFNKRSISRFEKELKIVQGLISQIEGQPHDTEIAP